MNHLPDDPRAIGFLVGKAVEMAQEMGGTLAERARLVEGVTDSRVLVGRGGLPNIRITLTIETCEGEP